MATTRSSTSLRRRSHTRREESENAIGTAAPDAQPAQNRRNHFKGICRLRLQAQKVIKNNIFACSLLAAIIIAAFTKSIGRTGGPLKPEITLPYLYEGTEFLVGLGIKTKKLKKTILNYKVHGLIQVYNLLMLPIMMFLVTFPLKNFVDENMLTGLMTVACMPSSIMSSVIITEAIGGNEAAAVFSALLSNLLSIVLTPLTLLLFLGFHTSMPSHAILKHLIIKMIIPLLLGQTVRYILGVRVTRWKSNFHVISSTLLLMIIYSTFCDLFSISSEPVGFITLITTSTIVLLIQIMSVFILFVVALRQKHWYTPTDTVAIVFSGYQKSLTIGMSLLQLMSTKAETIIIPMLIYHKLQMVVGGFLMVPFQKWVTTSKSQRRAERIELRRRSSTGS